MPPTEVDLQPVEQVVISPEDSAKHLEGLQQAKIEAELAEAKAKELAKLAEEAAEQARKDEENQKVEAARLAKIEAEKQAEAARLARVEAEKKQAILAKAEKEEEVRQAEAIHILILIMKDIVMDGDEVTVPIMLDITGRRIMVL